MESCGWLGRRRITRAQAAVQPEHVVGKFATLLKSYGVSQVSGDRFANVWPVEVFAKVGITYEQNAEPKGTLYTNMLPLINSCRVELLDEPRSIAQLCALEGRTARSGLDTIDHPLGGHDDLINAIAGVAVGCVGPLGNYDTTYRGWGGTDDTRS